jgi:hypothetical protein
MPGALVLMGEKGPRYSLDAFGFGSYVSMWLAPPGSQTTIRAVRFEEPP